MTEKLNLSQKLFVQKDGKKFAYANEIQKAIRRLKRRLNDIRKTYCGECSVNFAKEIDSVFGKELIHKPQNKNTQMDSFNKVSFFAKTGGTGSEATPGGSVASSGVNDKDAMIEQEKSNEELSAYGDKVIDLLEPLNKAEKYKVIKCLYESLLDILKKEGIIIEKD